MNLAECEHGEAERPEAEAANPGLARGDGERVRERLAQMRVGDPDELVERCRERLALLSGDEGLQVETRPAEDVTREPADATAPVLPRVLEHVGQLQPVPERGRE